MKFLIRILAIIMISFVLLGCGKSSDSTEKIQPETGIAGDGRLDLIVDYIIDKHKVPAMAAIMIHDGQIIEKSAMGKRSIDSNIQVTVDDQWHIGSITKSMTSTIAALVVKEGIINWDSTIADVYPELLGIMRPEYQEIRLDELLSHTSGIPNILPDYASYYNDQRELNLQRSEIIEKVLELTSETARGVYEYNNTGYIVAGTLLEKVTKKNWETLMRDYLFDPLLMVQSGFGAPATNGHVAQPVGHTLINGNWKPVDPSIENADNAPVLGPAGTVHTTLDDMAAYIGLHLKGLRGQSIDGFLDSHEFEKLYEPFPDSNYALGWVIDDDQSIWHNGSNTLWYAMIIVNEEKNTALFVVTNAADLDKNTDSKADKAITELVNKLNSRAETAFE